MLQQKLTGSEVVGNEMADNAAKAAIHGENNTMGSKFCDIFCIIKNNQSLSMGIIDMLFKICDLQTYKHMRL